MSTLAVPGTTLAYRLHGHEGRWISLVHGGLVATHSWRRQIPTDDDPGLCSAGRLIVHDQRGYGATPYGASGDGFGPLADDLIALWDVLEVDRAVVVGFSMGTMVALEAASRAPERVAGLVLVSGGILGDEARAVFAARAEEIERGDFAAQVDEHVRRAFSPGWVASHPAELAAYADAARTADPRAVAQTFHAIAAWGVPDLESLDAPALLINGSEDRMFTLAAASALAAHLQSAAVERVDGAGHTLHVEQPERFNARVRRFVEEVPTP